MNKRVSIQEFLKLSSEYSIVDVRSPGEYNMAYIPGATNIPLFSDEERKMVGICYKNEGRLAAIKLGLKFVGPKMYDFACEAEKLACGNPLLVHCWRGGMRSSNMAWLFNTVGIRTLTLEGGYKAYRNAVLEYFSLPWKLIILGGRTGSGKSDILKKMEEDGKQVLDLEFLAHHKGSSFGSIGQPPQPRTEHFENLMFYNLLKMSIESPVFVEDESRMIGRVKIPDSFFEKMRNAPVIKLDVPIEARIEKLVREYGPADNQLLREAVERIGKRLGGMAVKECIEALETNDYAKVVEITLRYYDKAYDFGISSRKPESVFALPTNSCNPDENVELIYNFVSNNLSY